MKMPIFLIKSELVRGLAMAGVFAVAGLVIGLLVIPMRDTGKTGAGVGPDFTLLGQRIPATDDALVRAQELARRYATSTMRMRLPDGSEIPVDLAQFGVVVERERLRSLVTQAADPTSRLRRWAQKTKPSGVLELPVPVAADIRLATATLVDLKDKVDKQPSDARLDLETRALVRESPGVQLDVASTFAALELALSEGKSTVDIVVREVAPRLKADQLGNVTFDDVLGYFETPYARGEAAQLRTYNLRLAASKLDGHVIMPGETFDFNEMVGPRDEAHGYKIAPVIAEGELVDGIGGGTCQISGTLHAAAFFSGLTIVSRRPHTRPSSYIKMGLDAAVSYPTITLKLRNDFSFPIVLHETVKNGTVRAEILGPKRVLTVTYVRKIVQTQAYEQVERQDKELPSGMKLLAQRGVPGFKVQRDRIIRDGAFAVRQRSFDVYPPTAQILRIGTGDMPKDKVKAQDDPHPEYTADEYLVTTQGPGIKTKKKDEGSEQPGGPMIERREQGKTGKAGWTKEAGYPFYQSTSERPR